MRALVSIMNFENLFMSENIPYKGKSQRDKFLSRVFGIFNEEIIRIWCKNSASPFKDLGRPTIYDSDGRHYTLDFLLQDKEKNTYITEMKCEIEYQKYKYLILNEITQLKHHQKKRAFQLLLKIAKSPNSFDIKCKGATVEVNGSALIWGKTSEKGIMKTIEEFSFSHILSTESIINDLINWEDKNYHDFIGQYYDWSTSLFSGLLAKT